MNNMNLENFLQPSNDGNNILVKIQATLLNANLIGIYQKKDENNFTLAVLPDPENPAKEMTLNDLIQELGKIPGVKVDVDSVKNAVNSVVKGEDISIQMHEIYYYRHKEKEKDITEYAFEITLKAKGLEIPGITVESASIAIWNTEKETELKRMGIADILSLIEDPSV